MTITQKPFGVTRDGVSVTLYTLRNSRGMEVEVLDYGCTLRALRVPDREGRAVDVCLGYESVGEYEENPGYLGAVVGRHANRIGGGRFTLGGREYHLACNDGPNHLHGGGRGFDKFVWACRSGPDGLRFSRTSPDREEGYPGTLETEVLYTLTEENALVLRYEARCDQDTVLNMTNHAYFNLGGQGSGPILDHLLQLRASSFAENDSHCLPTGRVLAVGGTPFDFRRPKPIGRDIEAVCEQLANGRGYDHNYVLDDPAQRKQAGVLYCPATGIRMAVSTTKPCIQLYTGNVLDAVAGKGGAVYGRRHALCLETQFYPNSLALGITPSAVLRKDEQYTHETVYRFDTVESVEV